MIFARFKFFKTIPEQDWRMRYAPMAIVYNEIEKVERTPLVSEAIFSLSQGLIKEKELHPSQESKNNQQK